MRMWNVQPSVMCRKHLLGEHVEMHMFAGCINKGKNISGYIDKGLVEISKINGRHEELALEMKRRCYKHSSPCPKIDVIKAVEGMVDISKSRAELARRCPECKRLQKKYKKRFENGI